MSDIVISTKPIKIKTKMKLKCLDCGSISKQIVTAVPQTKDDMNYKVKCKLCGEHNYVTADCFREMSEEAGIIL